jgi:glycosyltransferase involved in cell wall biosynthesis
MRVLMVAPGEVWGGAERQVVTLSLALQRRGHATKVVLLWPGQAARTGAATGLDVEVVRSRGTFDRRATDALRNLVESWRPDCVHLHGYKPVVYMALAGQRRAVFTQHGLPVMPSGNRQLRLRPRVYWFAELIALRAVGAHVAYVTRDLQARLSRYHRGLAQSVIHNGIDEAEVLSAPVQKLAAKPAVNFVAASRLDPVKGLDVAIQAWSRPEVPVNAHLWILGSGPLETALQQLAWRLGLSDRIHFEGFVDSPAGYIAGADAVLIPSYHEGLPYLALEALALRRALVASRVGGLAEVLSGQPGAILVRPGRPDLVAGAVATVCRRTSPESSVRLPDELTAAAMADRYLALYATV